MRLITIRNSAILFIILITVWLVVRTLRNHGVLWPETTPAPIAFSANLTLQNIKYTKTRAGAPLWTLRAESADHVENGITLVKNIQIVFFRKDKGNIELTADEGKLMPADGPVSVSSNVIVRTPSGQTLRTNFLEYEETSNFLRTKEVVQVSTDDYIVTAKGMQMDVSKQTWVLLKDVKGQLGDVSNF